ncbi:hypothetical protein PVT67_17205 [Gallaecimonas kandeliae]|uniref:hypothetical protein n=1 Tax=Gallaecimonas kandeliae TaxID=3029055 RepID=UPI002648038A|nr:hypothetical protein [Gallaecimonas kandeliae]WKE65380.1 hypothetical protein PVT67_17205 [Gallaecimonas kandeliae]
MRLFKKECICLQDGVIRYSAKDGDRVIPLADLAEVHYWWDMGVGFQHCLILVFSGGELGLDPDTKGVPQLLADLSEALAGFPKRLELDGLIDNELVCDKVPIWHRS